MPSDEAAMSSPCGDADEKDDADDRTVAAPFVLLVPTAKGDVIHGVNAVAAGFGLGPGQRATDASAAHENLTIAYADPAYEAAALARLAMAPNHAAAHAVSRHGATDRTIVTADAMDELLAAFPVAALRIDPASIALLHRLGLKTIGSVTRIPRAALKKRFGPRTKNRDPRDDTYDDYLGRTTGASDDVLARADEISGRVRIPLNPQDHGEPLRIAKGLVEPIMEVEVVLANLRPLVIDLMAMLAIRDDGVVALGLEAFRVDGGRSSTTLRLSRPTRDSDRIMRLLIDRLDGWQAEFGFDALAVEALEIAPLPPEQIDHAGHDNAPNLHALIDRLRTRLGREALLHPRMCESHIPERAFVWSVHEDRAQASIAPALNTSLWPQRLFGNPEEIGVLHAMPEGAPARFTWRRQTHNVERVAGPERIAPEWWCSRSTARARDYYRVETRENRCFWIYREGFCEDERGGPIRWFMHGLFS